MQLVIHAPFGGRINKAWGLALRKRFCRSFNFELQAAATDNGINIALAEQHSFPLGRRLPLPAARRPCGRCSSRRRCRRRSSARAGAGTPAARWRCCASAAARRCRSTSSACSPTTCWRRCFPDVAACQENIEGDIQIPDHPLVREVMKDVLTEAMDLDGLMDVLERHRRRLDPHASRWTRPCRRCSRTRSSTRTRTRFSTMRRSRSGGRARSRCGACCRSRCFARSAGSIRRRSTKCAQQAWPDVRDADELHDALLTLVAFPEARPPRRTAWRVATVGASRRRLDVGWRAGSSRCSGASRVTRARVDGRTYWVAAERARRSRCSSRGATFDEALPDVPRAGHDRDEASVQLVQGWLSHSGPTRRRGARRICSDSPADDVETAVLRLEAAGWALRGQLRLARSARGDPNGASAGCSRASIA